MHELIQSRAELNTSREPAVRSGIQESVRGLKVICDESFADPPEKPALSEGGHTGYPNDKGED